MATIRRRLKSVFEHFDKIGREHSNGSRVASQSAHPPEAVACVQRFDQVAFDEAQVAFRLAAPRVCCPDPAGESSREIRRSAHGGRGCEGACL